MKSTKIRLSRSFASPANAIFIIDCLDSEELQSGLGRYNGICDELLSINPTGLNEIKQKITHIQCFNLDKLAQSLDDIRNFCKIGVMPLIFIDGHGDIENGLKLPTGEFMSWVIFLEKLKSITFAACGELTVISAFCHSMAAIKHIDKSSRLPFSFYYGYQSEIRADLVDDETRTIYKSLLYDGGISWRNHSLQISSYSEYDHADELVAVTWMLAEAPDMLADKIPELSRGTLRKLFEKSLAVDGIPLSGSGKRFNEIVRSEILIIEFIKSLMHDTSRRERYISEVLEQLRVAPKT